MTTKHPTFDRNGYPTERTLKIIEKWSYNNIEELFAYLKESWSKDYGKIISKDGYECFITGGWSGNESIMSSLSKNFIIWSMIWISSHRGGLYVLKHPGIENDNLIDIYKDLF